MLSLFRRIIVHCGGGVMRVRVRAMILYLLGHVVTETVVVVVLRDWVVVVTVMIATVSWVTVVVVGFGVTSLIECQLIC